MKVARLSSIHIVSLSFTAKHDQLEGFTRSDKYFALKARGYTTQHIQNMPVERKQKRNYTEDSQDEHCALKNAMVVEE